MFNQKDQWDSSIRGQKMSNPQGVTVFKYPIPILESFTLDLPKDAQILRIDHIDGYSWLWALVDVNTPDEKRKFVAFKTGGTHPNVKSMDNLVYLGYHEIYVQQGLGLYLFEDKSFDINYYISPCF